MDGPGSGSGGLGSLTDVLAHYGVKGMKWGVRRKRPSGPSAVTVRTAAGRRVKTSGGARQPASDDAVRAATIRQVAKKSSTDALSNKDLQILVQRLNLERQYDSLRPRSIGEQASKFISDTLVSVGKEQTSRYARDAVSNQIADALKKK